MVYSVIEVSLPYSTGNSSCSSIASVAGAWSSRASSGPSTNGSFIAALLYVTNYCGADRFITSLYICIYLSLMIIRSNPWTKLDQTIRGCCVDTSDGFGPDMTNWGGIFHV